MILAIVPESSSTYITSCPPNVKAIDYRTFNSLEIHPFIATNQWERVDITLGKGIRSGYIKQVLSKNNILRATIPKDLELDLEIISRVTEILPMVASEIRKAFMSKQGLREILLREGVIFE